MDALRPGSRVPGQRIAELRDFCVTHPNALPDMMPFTLGLAGQRVLLVGWDSAALAYLEEQGAAVRCIAGPASAEDLAGVGLCLARAGDDVTRAAAGAAGVLVGMLPDAVPRQGRDDATRAAADAAGVLVSTLPDAAPRRGGRASLVGCGPGAVEMLTVRAVQVIRDADVVLHDKLVGPGVLDLVRPGARRVDVGKRCGRHVMSQAAINALIVREARAGLHVVRLKGGDPFVFGRGGEELESLRAAGVPTEVVPGITAALATAARLGIPLTHRGASRSLHLITAHGADDRLPEHDWVALARAGGTLAVYMGVRTLPLLAARLLGAGMAADTSAIAVENATLAGERRVLGTLGGIAADVAEAGVTGPTLVLIGAVVAMADVGAVVDAVRAA